MPHPLPAHSARVPGRGHRAYQGRDGRAARRSATTKPQGPVGPLRHLRVRPPGDAGTLSRMRGRRDPRFGMAARHFRERLSRPGFAPPSGAYGAVIRHAQGRREQEAKRNTSQGLPALPEQRARPAAESVRAVLPDLLPPAVRPAVRDPVRAAAAGVRVPGGDVPAAACGPATDAAGGMSMHRGREAE